MADAGVLTRRERNIAACLIDTVAAPGDQLPALAETSAVDAFDTLIAAGPALNRNGLRAMLYAIEVLPRLSGAHRRLRALPRESRAPAIHALLSKPAFKPLAAVCAVAKLAYYGEEPVMRTLGYDADAVLLRARAVRVAEARW